MKTSDFDVMEHRDILFNDCGDRVATLLHLRHKGGGGGGGSLVGLLHHSLPGVTRWLRGPYWRHIN